MLHGVRAEAASNADRIDRERPLAHRAQHEPLLPGPHVQRVRGFAPRPVVRPLHARDPACEGPVLFEEAYHRGFVPNDLRSLLEDLGIGPLTGWRGKSERESKAGTPQLACVLHRVSGAALGRTFPEHGRVAQSHEHLVATKERELERKGVLIGSGQIAAARLENRREERVVPFRVGERQKRRCNYDRTTPAGKSSEVSRSVDTQGSARSHCDSESRQTARKVKRV